MKKEDFYKGQTVYLLPVRLMVYDYLNIEKKIVETTVLSVGRRYITVRYLCDTIHFDTYNDFREATNYSVQYKLFLSKEDIQKDFKRRKMEDQIYAAIHYPKCVAKKMTFDELQTVFDIIKKYSKF